MVSLAIVVGPKGRGSNMEAIARACKAGTLKASIACVIAPTETAPALGRATELGLTSTTCPYAPEESYGERLAACFEGCDLICLAGYLRPVPAPLLQAFPERILNIHPSLLPEFGGKGMYGMHVHHAVLEAERSESGCTVHLVNDRYDEGRILVQRPVPVYSTDTAEALAARVLEQEHIAYPEAIQKRIHELGL